MTDTQKRYLSDAEADFQAYLLANEEAFFGFARLYLESAALMEPFLQWCWENYRGRSEIESRSTNETWTGPITKAGDVGGRK